MQMAHLKGHESKHTGEKPFECNICGKLFARNTTLKTHLVTHAKEIQNGPNMDVVDSISTAAQMESGQN